jgi:hypothetical protein
VRQLRIVFVGLVAMVGLVGCGGGGSGGATVASTSEGTTTRTTGGSTTPSTRATTTTGTTNRRSRRAGTLRKGQRVVFKATDIEVGDTVRCVSGSASVEATVPERGTGTFKHAEARNGRGSATISLGTREDGRVVAECQ